MRFSRLGKHVKLKGDPFMKETHTHTTCGQIGVHKSQQQKEPEVFRTKFPDLYLEVYQETLFINQEQKWT